MTTPTNFSGSRIFISYRRADTISTSGRIYERLVTHFGREAVFKDVDDIPYGVKFPEYLAEKLHECRVELVIIGQQWLTLTTPAGMRRLDDPGDFVRIEVEAGLQGGLIVIPVLVDNAMMPRSDDLPVSMHELIEFNAAQVRYDPDFNTDMEKLIRQLERWLGRVAAPAPAGITPPARDPIAAMMQQMTAEIEAAYKSKDWQGVLDKVAFLGRRAPAGNLPPAIYRMQADAYLAEGDLPAARTALDTALALDPLDVPTLQLAVWIRNQLGQYAETLPLFQDVLVIVNDATQRQVLLRDYVQALARAEQWAEALRRCEEALRGAPDDAVLLDVKLQALGKLNREADALKLVRTLTERPDATVDWWLARARLAYSVADDDEAKAALAAADYLFPNNPTVAEARHELFPPILSERLATLGFRGYASKVNGKHTDYFVPPVCDVAAGPFLMGSDPNRDPVAKQNWTQSEQPQHSIVLPTYAIARYPVTVAEYACFVRAGQPEPQGWKAQLSKQDHPVVNVSWHDAMNYANWLAERTGHPWRLPTEAEWEKAARSSDGRIYPWGDTFDQSRCNTSESGFRTTTPIGSYPQGASLYGAQDLAGNVWEWISSLYRDYPYTSSDGRENANSNKNRVLRGGSWSGNAGDVRSAFRNNNLPDNFNLSYGFRLVLAPPIS